MTIDELTINNDEAGFTLALTGDFVAEFERYLADPDAHTVRLKLPQDVALQLRAKVASEIEDWARDHDAAAHRFAGVAPSAIYLDDLAGVPDGLLEAVDLSRKAERERG